MYSPGAFAVLDLARCAVGCSAYHLTALGSRWGRTLFWRTAEGGLCWGRGFHDIIGKVRKAGNWEH